MEPKCENCYYFLKATDPNSNKYYYCLGDNYPYSTPAGIKGCRLWDKNACFKEKEDKTDAES